MVGWESRLNFLYHKFRLAFGLEGENTHLSEFFKVVNFVFVGIIKYLPGVTNIFDSEIYSFFHNFTVIYNYILYALGG